ncbi:DUF2955 domain-containing protein [Photobacterium leiognathi]|uniref:DUF2955 domain-containing protein n=1 Tax=Photobacterium leiognathi TaxID=553611 RepID=A0A2T3M5U7_PHOLE|nr:DUF2955 domain-containing protein [Photobacterium leiognathi]KJF94202.1 membrane protein [Photobacterium leiognathi]PSV87270.1 DUF2955 domain-containing protein [Photobacterium leiognathi]
MKQFISTDALRTSLIVCICMMFGKLFHVNSHVYFALFPIIIATKVKDYSWKGLSKTFAIVLLSAYCAVFVSEVFSDHPFIIWTISIVLFDQLRKRADSPAKVGALFIPTINWILNVVFALHTTMDMPQRLHEVGLAIVVSICVTKLFLWLLPPKPKAGFGKPKSTPVTAKQRLISVSLIGLGLGFLMIVDLVSGAFCMVPVIAAATQTSRKAYLNVVKSRFVTQVGGCAIAAVFMLLIAGYQSNFILYGLGLFALIYAITHKIYHDQGPHQELHADILLATMLPIQLYMSNSELGLSNTFLRGWELSCTLGILALFYFLTTTKQRYVTELH